MARVRESMSNVCFLLAGQGVSHSNTELMEELLAYLPDGAFRVMGPCQMMPDFLSALDVFVLSSRSEGFPNVVGEAMACGTPVVCTNVGEAESLVADTGTLVPRGDAHCLAQSVLDMLCLSDREREALGVAARQRIIDQYSVDTIGKEYYAIYSQCNSG